MFCCCCRITSTRAHQSRAEKEEPEGHKNLVQFGGSGCFSNLLQGAQSNKTQHQKQNAANTKQKNAALVFHFPPIFANIADATNATNERRRSVPFVQSSFRLTLTAHTLPSFSQDADELVKGETKKALLLLPSLHLRGTNTQSSSVFFSSSPPSKTKAPPHFLLRSA